MSDDKHNILITAISLFKKYGLQGVTMNDVAQQLGISKKTLYVYFSSKEALLCGSVQLFINQMNLTIEDTVTSHEHPLQKILKISIKLLAEFSSMDSVYFYTLNKTYPKVIQLIESFRNEFINTHLQPLFIAAYEQKCFSKDVDIDLFMKIRFLKIDQHYFELKTVAPDIVLKECFYHLVAYQLIGICTSTFQNTCKEFIEEISI